MAIITEKQLGQRRPDSTVALSIYQPPLARRGIVKHVTINNTSGADAEARLYHDDDGSTYDESTELLRLPVKAGKPITIDVFWPSNNVLGNFAVKSSVADALTFTFFGYEVL